jgi:poly [ADP-ribose] polymerase
MSAVSTVVLEHRKFVCSDALNNNNKFWEFIKHDDGTVTIKYGRVGSTSNVETKPMTDAELARKVKEKTNPRGKEGTASYKPPYLEIKVVSDVIPATPTGPSMSAKVVAEAAKAQLIANADPELTRLIEHLVKQNRHELHKASGGQMDIDLSTGIVSTPVGVITKEGVDEARKLLNKMSPLVLAKDFDSKVFVEALNNYLMLAPQKVGHSRGLHRYFISDASGLQQQTGLLDQLESSADLAAARLIAAKNGPPTASIATTPSLFDAKIEILTDKDEIKRIEKFFRDTVNSRHESQHLRPIRFYTITHAKSDKAYDLDGKKLGNEMQLWHGTRAHNVLSIMKGGLIIPKSGGSIQVTGRMFGDGQYFSDQSTKSLNYAYGYWDGAGREHNCFMFLFDVAMGKMHHPTRPGNGKVAGYDSCFAKAQQSGVMNNEMIVYRESQSRPRFLIEFDKK